MQPLHVISRNVHLFRALWLPGIEGCPFDVLEGFLFQNHLPSRVQPLAIPCVQYAWLIVVQILWLGVRSASKFPHTFSLPAETRK
jgi:hypothetical protein